MRAVSYLGPRIPGKPVCSERLERTYTGVLQPQSAKEGNPVLVKFHTPTRGNITYNGKVGVALLKLMGRTGNVPGALDAERVPEALERLKSEIVRLGGETEGGGAGVDVGKDQVALHARAYPLIEMLESAVEEGEFISWE